MTGKQFVLAMFFAVFLGVIGKSVWSKIQLRRKGRTSLAWPLTKATIFRSSVDRVNMGESGVVYRLEAGFAYSALGPLGVAPGQYEGVYRQDFANPHEAERLLESLKAGPFLVRYDPSAADDYFVDPYRDVREAEPSQ